jgi:hypothetical protein
LRRRRVRGWYLFSKWNKQHEGINNVSNSFETLVGYEGSRHGGERCIEIQTACVEVGIGFTMLETHK